MRKLVLSLLGASALAISSGASAVTILPGSAGPGIFITSPSPVPIDYTGTITATIGHVGIAAGSFTDDFQFQLPYNGLGGGSITTDLGLSGQFLGSTDLDINSVTVNGVMAVEVLKDINGVVCFTENVGTCGATETWSLNNVTLNAGAVNHIIVTGLSRGNGAYGGNIAAAPTGVPEPATWAMMLLGFGGIGWQFRRKRSTAIPQFA